jgi:Protein of unknown function (DUF3102)
MAPKKNPLDGADLGELATLANKYHAEVENTGLSMLIAAWNAGHALLIAKSLCAHGDWLPWLAECFDGSQQSASDYMRIASNYQRAGDLDPTGSIRGALEAIRAELREVNNNQGELESGSKALARQRNTPVLPGGKFEKRYIAFTDDLSFMIQNASDDDEFAAAAFNAIEHLRQQRDDLTKFIAKLRGMFKSE